MSQKSSKKKPLWRIIGIMVGAVLIGAGFWVAVTGWLAFQDNGYEDLFYEQLAFAAGFWIVGGLVWVLFSSVLGGSSGSDRDDSDDDDLIEDGVDELMELVDSD